MLLRAWCTLLLLLSACATIEPRTRGPVTPNPASPRIANLRRAAALPWVDDGHCVVREASNGWPVLAERCYYALDHNKVRFQDRTGKCAVAVAPAVAVGVGICILAAAEIIAETVVVVGSAVVVAAAIVEALEAWAQRSGKCNCMCLGSGSTDGRGNPVRDGPYQPSKSIGGDKAINTQAQCHNACQMSGYASGFCK